MANPFLKSRDAIPNPSDRIEQCRVDGGVGLGQVVRGNPQRLTGQFDPVQSLVVPQHGRGARFPHVTADAVDDGGRGERLAEHPGRQFAASGRDDVAPRAQFFSQSGQNIGRIVTGIDPGDQFGLVGG